MSNLATKIQTWVRHYADQGSISITSGDGLDVLNEVYHGMFNPDYRISAGGRLFEIGRNWPEAYQSNDMGVNTTSGTSAYAWLASPIYREEPVVELETAVGSGEYDIIPMVTDEAEWTRFSNLGNNRPLVYRRQLSGSTMQIVFAPTPDTTGLDIVLRGQIEITKFTAATAIDETTNTIFFNEEPDQALAYFIAARLQVKFGDPAQSHNLVQSGLGLLPSVERMPARDVNRIEANRF